MTGLSKAKMTNIAVIKLQTKKKKIQERSQLESFN